MGISTAGGHRTAYGGTYEEDLAFVVATADDRERAGAAAAQMQGVEDASSPQGLCAVGPSRVEGIPFMRVTRMNGTTYFSGFEGLARFAFG
jgi:hypothetical protein